jgi:hypothetical protein
MLFIRSRVAALAASNEMPTVRSSGSGSSNSIPPVSWRVSGNGLPFRRNLISMNSFMGLPQKRSSFASPAIPTRGRRENSATVSYLIDDDHRGFPAPSTKGSRMASDATLAMQKQILANQKKILANQQRIQRNQAKLDKIVTNQRKLDQILANQKAILARLR